MATNGQGGRDLWLVPVLVLLATAALAFAAAPASAHEPESDRWAPWKGGPRLGLPAAEVLRQLPVASDPALDYDPARDVPLTASDIRRLSGAPTAGRALVHRAGGRPARSAGPVARAERRDTGVQAAEPTLGVTRDGTLFFVGIQGGQHNLIRSRDGGVTWDRVDPGVSGQSADENTFDPFIYVDPRTDRLWDADLTTPSCATISFSDDGGETFTAAPNCHHTDHQNLFTDPEGTAYYCSNDGGATIETLATGCSKSTDGGLTWVRTGAPAYVNDPSRTGGSFGIKGFCSGATGHGVAAPNGTIYVPRGYCDQPYIAISKDQGATWERVQVADKGVIVGIEDEIVGSSAGLAVEDHEAGVAVDAEGNLFYFWIGVDHLPYLVVSRDGGKTWGKAMMVAAPGVNEAWGPSIVAAEKGRIAFTYMGTTNSPGGPYCVRTTSTTTCETADGSPATPPEKYEGTTWHGYMAMSVDALAADPVFRTAAVSTPEDPLVAGAGCGPVRCLAELDFLDVVIAKDGTAWASFVDGCDGVDACGGNGMGIVGHLVGGPPLDLTHERPPVVAPTPSKRCDRARRVTLRVGKPKRGRLRSVRATVNGRRVKASRRGRGYVVRVDLRRFSGKRVTVKIVARTSTKRSFTTTKRYRVCG